MSKLFKLQNKYQEASHSQAVETLQNQASRYFIGDEMFIANRNMHFFNDEKFVRLLDEIAAAPMYRGMAWRLHTLVWAAKKALKLDGDFMECGVFRGFKSFFLLKYFEQQLANRSYYLCDTYEGVDLEQNHLSPIAPQEHAKSKLYEFVKLRFSVFENAQVIKGSVPGSLQDLSIEKIAFLHLDMNAYQAEIGALEFLWEKIVPSGVIVLDDFGFEGHQAQMEREQSWFADKGYAVLELPTGQGVVIK